MPEVTLSFTGCSRSGPRTTDRERNLTYTVSENVPMTRDPAATTTPGTSSRNHPISSMLPVVRSRTPVPIATVGGRRCMKIKKVVQNVYNLP